MCVKIKGGGHKDRVVGLRKDGWEGQIKKKLWPQQRGFGDIFKKLELIGRI